jgi:hypothetical protein
MATKKREFEIFHGHSGTESGRVARINQGELTKIISIAASGMGAGYTIVLKVQGSTSDTQPDFDSAVSSTNKWNYLAYTDIDTNTITAGATGITITNAAVVKTIKVNTEGFQWITMDVTSISDPENTLVHVTLTPYNQYVDDIIEEGGALNGIVSLAAEITKLAKKGLADEIVTSASKERETDKALDSSVTMTAGNTIA